MKIKTIQINDTKINLPFPIYLEEDEIHNPNMIVISKILLKLCSQIEEMKSKK